MHEGISAMSYCLATFFLVK